MSITATINRQANVQVTVTQQEGRITGASDAITLRNYNKIIVDNLVDIGDVVNANVVNGATVVYNSNTGNYELKPIDYDLLSGDIDNIDGGSF